ncbi:sirohydrochlorin chelatase [Mobilicoccus pelagius]|uniref:Ferrochelatase n=1 Tax=Mobilicoccus pelagius NBRC 104925 TaxID=1089455 RepID=H5UR04_9MICO|nr:CbiX/SirB N-terminal domain-containing protein [Mobilicoccus pelagius]GAB48162.1 hypothetical protein MOPEL_067_00110 [Mobilicoccus pelagius NBRC 104925]
MSVPLVLAAHGTTDPAGRAVAVEVAQRAGERLGVEARVGFVDVCGPELAGVLGEFVDAEDAPVVVPFFLAAGYHVRHDVPAAVHEAAPSARVTPWLGEAPEVLDALAGRIAEVEREPEAVVLAAAGSSDVDARSEVEAVATALGSRLDVPVAAAFLTGPGATPAEAVADLRSRRRRHVVLAAHLLAPGVFLRRLTGTAEDLDAAVTDAIGSHEAIVSLVERRYREVG